jgi:hypothetical protein
MTNEEMIIDLIETVAASAASMPLSEMGDRFSKSSESIELVRDSLYALIGMDSDMDWVRQAVEVLADRAMGGDLAGDLSGSPDLDQKTAFSALCLLLAITSDATRENRAK